VSRVIAVCPHCHKKYRVDVRLIGRKTNCKQCKTEFSIAAEDPEDSFDIPDASEYMANQAFDPLAPPVEAEDDPAQDPDQHRRQPVPPPIQVRDWKQQIKQARRESAFGALPRSLLGVGVLLALVSVTINLAHILGWQPGEGNAVRLAGLIIGLLGAGSVAGSLYRFPAAARLAGAAAAIFVFAVFLASVINAQKRQGDTGPRSPEADADTVESLEGFGSPWYASFPGWQGFDSMQRMPAPADRWNRQQLANTNCSATFPGQPRTESRPLRIAGTSAQVTSLASRFQDFDFSLGVVALPEQVADSVPTMLDDFESTLGLSQPSEAIEFGGFAGREYRLVSSSRSAHGRFLAVDRQIVHVRTSGRSTLVPGALSREFLASLQLRPRTDEASASPPRIRLTESQSQREAAINGRLQQIESLISSHIRAGGLMNFPPAYLSISSGQDAGNRRFLFHPGKLPVLGVDLIVVESPAGSALANLAPIFDKATDDQSIMARPGYALAGIETNAEGWVKGIRLVFMKMTPRGFDTSQSYRTAWYGTPASGLPGKVGGDGSPVYGVWICRTSICKSIGLIREST
jgi:hypothetical protein